MLSPPQGVDLAPKLGSITVPLVPSFTERPLVSLSSRVRVSFVCSLFFAASVLWKMRVNRTSVFVASLPSYHFKVLGLVGASMTLCYDWWECGGCCFLNAGESTQECLALAREAFWKWQCYYGALLFFAICLRQNLRHFVKPSHSCVPNDMRTWAPWTIFYSTFYFAT